VGDQEKIGARDILYPILVGVVMARSPIFLIDSESVGMVWRIAISCPAPWYLTASASRPLRFSLGVAAVTCAALAVQEASTFDSGKKFLRHQQGQMDDDGPQIV